MNHLPLKYWCAGCILCLSAIHSPSQTFTEASIQSGINFTNYSPALIGGGCAFFDYNNDGWLDIYITGGMKTDRLYRNNGNGAFTDVSAAAGIRKPGLYTQGVVTGDIDNDGDRDIFVTTMGNDETFNNMVPNVLFRNNGNGTFTDISFAAGIRDSAWSVSATMGDYNLDGFLDIYVANYVDTPGFIEDSSGDIIGFAHKGYPNYLYLNNGNNTFSQIAPQLQVNNRGNSLATVFTDYDNDRDADIYIANDFGEWAIPNVLYRNEYPQNVFSDVSVASGANAAIYGMGIAIGDYDEDGHLDYYTTNIGRNVLFHNNGNGTFTDVTDAAGVTNTYIDTFFATSWGTSFFDYDNNTWLDLFVAHGRIPAADFIATGEGDPQKLFRNNTDGTFTDVSLAEGVSDSSKCRGFATGDYDNDGDLDLLLVATEQDTLNNDGDHVLLFRNDLSNGNYWLKVQMQGTQNNRDGYGSRVEVYAGGRKWLREIDGGSSHASQHSSIAHFGLGNFTAIDSLVVFWPGGGKSVVANVPANQLITIVEGGPSQLENHRYVEFCQGDSVFAGGEFQTSNGIYYDTFSLSGGVDSVVITHLIVFPDKISSFYYSICEGDSFLINGSYYRDSIILYDTLLTAKGCDSIVIRELEVLPLRVAIADVILCDGDSIYAGGAWQKENGNYYDTVPASLCDFVTITSVYVVPSIPIDTVLQSLCEGDSFFTGGGWQTEEGVYTDTLTSIFGCDSIMVTEIEVAMSYTATRMVTICEGDSFFTGGDFQKIPGSYFDHLITRDGCDSLLETALIVIPSIMSFDSVIIAEGDSVFLSGVWQKEPGIFADTSTGFAGCDSIVLTVLSIVPTGIDELRDETFFSVYPNPAVDNIMVRYFIPAGEAAEIKISSITGTMVMKTEKMLNGFQDSIEVDILPPGIYYVSLKTHQRLLIHKLIIF